MEEKRFFFMQNTYFYFGKRRTFERGMAMYSAILFKREAIYNCRFYTLFCINI